MDSNEQETKKNKQEEAVKLHQEENQKVFSSIQEHLEHDLNKQKEANKIALEKQKAEYQSKFDESKKEWNKEMEKGILLSKKFDSPEDFNREHQELKRKEVSIIFVLLKPGEFDRCSREEGYIADFLRDRTIHENTQSTGNKVSLGLPMDDRMRMFLRQKMTDVLSSRESYIGFFVVPSKVVWRKGTFTNQLVWPTCNENDLVKCIISNEGELQFETSDYKKEKSSNKEPIKTVAKTTEEISKEEESGKKELQKMMKEISEILQDNSTMETALMQSISVVKQMKESKKEIWTDENDQKIIEAFKKAMNQLKDKVKNEIKEMEKLEDEIKTELNYTLKEGEKIEGDNGLANQIKKHLDIMNNGDYKIVYENRIQHAGDVIWEESKKTASQIAHLVRNRITELTAIERSYSNMVTMLKTNEKSIAKKFEQVQDLISSTPRKFDDIIKILEDLRLYFGQLQYSVGLIKESIEAIERVRLTMLEPALEELKSKVKIIELNSTRV